MNENKVCYCKGDSCTCAYGKSADRVTDALVIGGGVALAVWIASKLLK